MSRDLYQYKIIELARRLGVDTLALQDVACHLQLTMLSTLVDLVAVALEDECIDPITAGRILDRIIHSGMPQAHEADQRLRQVREETVRLATAPIVWPRR